MKLGTTILLWAAAGAAVGVGISAVVAGGSVTPIAVAGGMFVGLIAPLAWMLNRDHDRLRIAAQRMEEDGASFVPRTSPVFKSVVVPLRMAVEEAVSETDTIRGQVRELEIRSRINDGERTRLEEVLQSLQDAVVVTNQYSEVKLANPAASEILGISTPDDLNRSIDQVIENAAVRQLLHEAHGTQVASHRKRMEIDLPISGAAEDATRTYEATLACLPDPNEPIGGVVLILRDISREREISQMKSEFVSKASHELRTPLSSIHAYIEMLLDGEADDEASQTEFHQIIKNEADRLGRLIDNMLNISRIEAGIVKAKFEEIDFVKAANAALEVIEPQAKLKDITVRVKSGPLLYTAEADRDMLHQIFLNFLSNAVKYTPEGGRVTVTIDNDETSGSVMATIADTGLGIPPDALPRVFDKFYRIENYKRVAKGTGLGLNLVKHIVETVHHGQVSVSSELGMGSQFVFSIPYTRQGLYGAAA